MSLSLFNSPWSLRVRAMLWWAAIAVALWGAWQQYGGMGLALGVSMLAFWMTIQFSQMMRVLRRAAERPKGTVAHAMKLHVKLKPGQKLIQIIGWAGSLGEACSEPGVQPEVFRWRDPQGDAITARFLDGRLLDHQIVRAEPSGTEAGLPQA